MTDIREAITSAYHEGLESGEDEARRQVSRVIIDAALAQEVLSADPRSVLMAARAKLEVAPLDEQEADDFSERLLEFLVRKNGHAVVLKDREDMVSRASFEAFHSTIEYDGIEGVAADVERLILGKAGSVELSSESKHGD